MTAAPVPTLQTTERSDPGPSSSPPSSVVQEQAETTTRHWGIALDLPRLRLLTIVAPSTFLLLLELLGLFVLHPLLGHQAVVRILILFALLALAAIPFSFWVFSVIERQQHQMATTAQQLERRVHELSAVNTAITSVSRALDLSSVLQSITDAARTMVEAQYAALGVADAEGRITAFITSGITEEQRAAIGPPPQGHGLLGVLITEGTPLRISDISQDPRHVGFPPHHPVMTTLLGVPLLFHGQPVGDLYLANKIGAADFSEEDQEVLLLLANHAAVAIQNARLYEEVRQTRDQLQTWNAELEAKVADRTSEIQRYSKELTTRVLQAQEAERKRIARELHDDTAQSLSTLLINLDLLDPFLPHENTVLQAGFERVRSLVQRTLDEVRALSHDLRPTILDDFGLVAALHWYAEQFTETFRVPVTVEADEPGAGMLTDEMVLALFRIAQEGLMNAGKYAEATRALVRLSIQEGRAILLVEDQGTGFDVDAVPRPTHQGGLGLHGMRERADLIGAELSIESTPGEGTRIMVTVPLTSEDHAQHQEVLPLIKGGDHDEEVRPLIEETSQGESLC